MKTIFSGKSRKGDQVFMGAAFALVLAAIIFAPLLASAASSMKSQGALYQSEVLSSMSNEIFNFMYTYKRTNGTTDFINMVSGGVAAKCDANAWDPGDTVPAVDDYCISHPVISAGDMTVTPCAYSLVSGSSNPPTDIKNVVCTANDASYPDAFYPGFVGYTKVTVRIHQDPTDLDIVTGWISIDNQLLGYAKDEYFLLR